MTTTWSSKSRDDQRHQISIVHLQLLSSIVIYYCLWIFSIVLPSFYCFCWKKLAWEHWYCHSGLQNGNFLNFYWIIVSEFLFIFVEEKENCPFALAFEISMLRVNSICTRSLLLKDFCPQIDLCLPHRILFRSPRSQFIWWDFQRIFVGIDPTKTFTHTRDTPILLLFNNRHCSTFYCFTFVVKFNSHTGKKLQGLEQWMKMLSLKPNKELINPINLKKAVIPKTPNKF